MVVLQCLNFVEEPNRGHLAEERQQREGDDDKPRPKVIESTSLLRLELAIYLQVQYLERRRIAMTDRDLGNVSYMRSTEMKLVTPENAR